MKMKKVSAVLMTTLLLGSVGCAQQSSNEPAANTGNQSGSNTQTTTQSETKKEKKAVVIWDYFETDAQKQMMQTLIDGFNASQDDFVASHVYVPFSDYEKQLTLGIASGELPDIVILDGCGMASFISLGLFADITDAASDIKWDEYIAGPLDSTMMDGRNYGIPFATNCTALFYNKDLFDAAGVSYPDEIGRAHV